MTARSVTFSEVPMWIQMWGLPFDLINDEEGLDIGKRLGRVVEVDKKTFSSDQARFIRVRVAIPLEKPIRRGGYVSNPKGDQVQIGFKYERLVGLCFQCGLFGHDAKECKKQKTQTRQPHLTEIGLERDIGERRMARTESRTVHRREMLRRQQGQNTISDLGLSLRAKQ